MAQAYLIYLNIINISLSVISASSQDGYAIYI